MAIVLAGRTGGTDGPGGTDGTSVPCFATTAAGRIRKTAPSSGNTLP